MKLSLSSINIAKVDQDKERERERLVEERRGRREVRTLSQPQLIIITKST